LFRSYCERLVRYRASISRFAALPCEIASVDAQFSNLVRDFKRITTRIAKIDWQRNFFDHRLRHDESEYEKVAYIRANPVRAGLITESEEWPYAIDANDLDSGTLASIKRSAGD
jgi:hypothetical protein